jgi:hypothetical protein
MNAARICTTVPTGHHGLIVPDFFHAFSIIAPQATTAQQWPRVPTLHLHLHAHVILDLKEMGTSASTSMNALRTLTVVGHLLLLL